MAMAVTLLGGCVSMAPPPEVQTAALLPARYEAADLAPKPLVVLMTGW